ncbi:MAG: hypothetical protein IPN76_23600 [Saprospiraceae bacterium]|nr:hypothetical protein [Saprospiraceae bacterium]
MKEREEAANKAAAEQAEEERREAEEAKATAAAEKRHEAAKKTWKTKRTYECRDRKLPSGSSAESSTAGSYFSII